MGGPSLCKFCQECTTVLPGTDGGGTRERDYLSLSCTLTTNVGGAEKRIGTPLRSNQQTEEVGQIGEENDSLSPTSQTTEEARKKRED